MKQSFQKYLRGLAAGISVCTAIVGTGCIGYHYDVPRSVLQAPEAQVWGVAVLESKEGFRVTSITRLNGDARMHEQPAALIASGGYQNWNWSVKAAPSLLPSWNAWKADQKVRRREGAGADDWRHPAANWDQAFQRAYKVSSYLVKGTPLSLRTTLLLIPDGSMWRGTSTASDPHAIPISLGFYYPSSGSPLADAMGERFSALTTAVARTVYEYQHVVFKNTVRGEAKLGNKAREAVNDETRSQCWYDSTLLALTSGTHSAIRFDPSAARLALSEGSTSEKITADTGERTSGTEGSGSPPSIKVSEAVPWAQFLVAQSVADYLRQRGLKGSTVSARNPAAMNAVLSACRAMTQRPVDLTKGAYPASQVEYVPFFPVPLGLADDGTKKREVIAPANGLRAELCGNPAAGAGKVPASGSEKSSMRPQEVVLPCIRL